MEVVALTVDKAAPTPGRLSPLSTPATVAQVTRPGASNPKEATSPAIEASRKRIPKLTQLQRRYTRFSRQGFSDATGTLTLTFEPPKQGTLLRITRIFAKAPQGMIDVYIGEVADEFQVDFAPNAAKVTFDMTRALVQTDSMKLHFVFSGAGNNAKCTVNLQAELERVDGK